MYSLIAVMYVVLSGFAHRNFWDRLLYVVLMICWVCLAAREIYFAVKAQRNQSQPTS